MNHKTLSILSLLMILLFLQLDCTKSLPPQSGYSVSLLGRKETKNQKEPLHVLPPDLQDMFDLASDETEQLQETVDLERRMLLVATDDYPGTGANNHHDPKPPGTR